MEKLSNEPFPIPIEGLKVIEQKIEALKIEVLQEHTEKDEYIKGKIVDLETLTARGEKIAKLKEEIKKVLEESIPFCVDLNSHKNPELERHREEIVGIILWNVSLLALLLEQEKEVFEKINEIGKQTDVTGKIYEEGMK